MLDMLLVIFYLFTFLNKKADVFVLLRYLIWNYSNFTLIFHSVLVHHIPYEIANWSISMALYDNQVHSILIQKWQNCWLWNVTTVGSLKLYTILLHPINIEMVYDYIAVKHDYFMMKFIRWKQVWSYGKPLNQESRHKRHCIIIKVNGGMLKINFWHI